MGEIKGYISQVIGPVVDIPVSYTHLTDRTITQGTGSRGDRQRDQAADKSEGGH